MNSNYFTVYTVGIFIGQRGPWLSLATMKLRRVQPQCSGRSIEGFEALLTPGQHRFMLSFELQRTCVPPSTTSSLTALAQAQAIRIHPASLHVKASVPGVCLRAYLVRENFWVWIL